MGKHFLSVLGTSNYDETIYYCEEKQSQTPFIQQAVLDLKLDELGEGDRITIFVTEKSMSSNWETRAYKDFEKERALKNKKILPEMKIGLKDILEKEFTGHGVDIDMVMIPVGASQSELWQIFEIINGVLCEGERVYIDITHSLRNIPIQMLAVISYARVVKNIEVEGIYYGAFEVGEYNADGIKEAPVFDLVTFLDILDWSQAASSFVKYGNSDQIAELYDAQRKNSPVKQNELHKVISELQNITHGLENSRGYYDQKNTKNNSKGKSILGSYKQYEETYDIMQRKDDKQLEENKKQGSIIKPLGELMGLIDEKVSIFNVETNLELGMAAIEWAVQHQRTQQGFTALEETIKTYLCNHYGLDETEERYRDHICKSVCNELKNDLKDGKTLSEDVREEAFLRWVSEPRNAGKTAEDKDAAHRVIMDVPQQLVKISKEVSDCRNSMNHFGYSNKGVFNNKKLEDNLNKYFKEFKALIG